MPPKPCSVPSPTLVKAHGKKYIELTASQLPKCYTPSRASWLLHMLEDFGIAKKVGFKKVHLHGRPAVLWRLPVSILFTFEEPSTQKAIPSDDAKE